MLPLLFSGLVSLERAKRGTKMENSPLQLFHLYDQRLILFLRRNRAWNMERKSERASQKVMGTAEVNYFSLRAHVGKILS